MDRVEVLCLVAPEVELDERVWILPAFQNRLGVLLQYVSDLFRPGDHGAFEDVRLVFTTDPLRCRAFARRDWEERTSIHLSNGHIDARQEPMELVLDQIFGHKVGPPLLVILIREDG